MDLRHARRVASTVRSALDPSLSALADALNEIYRLASSPRFHAETVAATGVPLSRHGLRFLSMVRDCPGISARRLADAHDVSQATASRVMAQLEGDGLVRRATSDADGRVGEFTVTAAGVEALATVHAFHVGRLTAALGDLAPARRADLARAVGDLVARLVTAAPAPSSAARRTA